MENAILVEWVKLPRWIRIVVSHLFIVESARLGNDIDSFAYILPGLHPWFLSKGK